MSAPALVDASMTPSRATQGQSQPTTLYCAEATPTVKAYLVKHPKFRRKAAKEVSFEPPTTESDLPNEDQAKRSQDTVALPNAVISNPPILLSPSRVRTPITTPLQPHPVSSSEMAGVEHDAPTANSIPRKRKSSPIEDEAKSLESLSNDRSKRSRIEIDAPEKKPETKSTTEAPIDLHYLPSPSPSPERVAGSSLPSGTLGSSVRTPLLIRIRAPRSLNRTQTPLAPTHNARPVGKGVRAKRGPKDDRVGRKSPFVTRRGRLVRAPAPKD